MAKVTPLENLCFDCIIQKLEQYKTEDLSLLPKKYRVEALLQLPIVDVCRLEDTRFTADIVMDTIWEQLYEKYIGSTSDIEPEENWKHSLLSKLTTIILKCERLYGYFLRKPKFDRYRLSTVCSVSPTYHPADIVNYLIAIQRDTLQTKKQHPQTIDNDQFSDYQIEQQLSTFFSHEVMTCFQVTVTEGVVSQGKAYQEGLKANQIIP